jgi:F-type H+-transporting ATPase subunit alpha
MDLNPSEVTSVLKQEIEGFESRTQKSNVGTVLQVGDGVARIHGLDECMMSELLEFPNGIFGVALNLEEDNVGAVLLGSETGVKEGDEVKTTGRIISVPTGDAMLGRVVDALGRGRRQATIDDRSRPAADRGPRADRSGAAAGQGAAADRDQGDRRDDPDRPRPARADHRGPRDRQDRNLRRHDPQPEGDRRWRPDEQGPGALHLRRGRPEAVDREGGRAEARGAGAMAYTTVVSAPASAPAAMQYLACYTGCAIGERFRDEGRHVVIFYDDLYKQALAYRQVMLLLRRPPGREAFPGDVFNLHSRLLERAAKLSDEKGGGSLTALPIVETQEGDVSAYIPTNVISITDGQIFLESSLFNAGQRPAVNAGISVSRVGGSAQIPAMKKVAGGLRIGLAQYRELAAFAQFGSDLDKATQQQINRGRRLEELLKQPQYSPVPVEEQVAMIYAGTSGLLDVIDANRVGEFEKGYIEFLRASHGDLLEKIRVDKKWTPELASAFDEAGKKFVAEFTA